MTEAGEPVMRSTRSVVPGYRSECEETLTRAPDISINSLMEAPPTPMKEPAKEWVMRNFMEINPWMKVAERSAGWPLREDLYWAFFAFAAMMMMMMMMIKPHSKGNIRDRR